MSLLIIPFVLTVLLCKHVVDIPTDTRFFNPLRFRKSKDPGLAFSGSYIDSCSRVFPQELTAFDPSNRSSAEFVGSVATDVDPPALNRVFTTFFKIYLFQPNSDIIVNLSATGRGRPTDIRDGLLQSQRSLRMFFDDDSIVVQNYSLGYCHLDRVRGSRYIFHLDSLNKTNPRRRDVVAIQRTFDGRCFISVREVGRHVFEQPVYMIVPYSRRPVRLKWFLDRFDRLRAQRVLTRLILAVCKDIPGDISVANELVVSLRHSRDVQVVAVPGDRTGFFSRAVAIREGAAFVPQDSIMFISDVDMYIFPPMFDSCRYNPIQGSQVYFPVFYSLYAGSTRIDRNAGYWRDSSHGMSCMYRSDFDAIGAYKHAERRFVGWGGEDVILSQAFLTDSRYEVFRAIEPALRHKWHMKHCEQMTAAYDDCIEIAFQQLGTMASVGRHLLKKKLDAQRFYAEFTDSDDAGDTSIIRRTTVEKGSTENVEAEKLRTRQELLQKNFEDLKRRKAAKG